jgi:hypothetical protein
MSKVGDTTILLWKESLNSNGQQFYQFIINKTNNNLSSLLAEHKKGATYKFENQLKPLELAFHFTGRYCLF